jgi:hypothetical protein
MMQCDLQFVLRDREPWFGYAGLVAEWIGFPRWTIGVADNRALLIDRVHATDLRDVPAERDAVVEVVGDVPLALPLGIAMDGDSLLVEALRRCVGLYSDLENYHGIRGVTETPRVTAPFSFSRHLDRPVVNMEGIADFPTDPLVYEIPRTERPDRTLLRSTCGRSLIVRRGRHLLLGIPLFSLLARHLTAPAMDGDVCCFCEPVHHLAELLAVIIASSVPAGSLCVRPWPNDARGVFALRHDDDRPSALSDLIAREAALGVRPSIHMLPDRIPRPSVLKEYLERGAEIALHSRRLESMEADRRMLSELTGVLDVGQSAHGGRGADGWQGMLNLVAADRGGLAYTELLSEMHLWPHRVPDLGSGAGAALGPIAMPHHLSADVDMRRDDCERLRREIGRVLRCNGLFTLMHHPDINVEAVFSFLSEAVPPDVARMTLLEVAKWWRATHVRDCLDLRTDVGDRRMHVCGRLAPDQRDLVFEVTLPAFWHELVVSSSDGAAACAIPDRRVVRVYCNDVREVELTVTAAECSPGSAVGGA